MIELFTAELRMTEVRVYNVFFNFEWFFSTSPAEYPVYVTPVMHEADTPFHPAVCALLHEYPQLS